VSLVLYFKSDGKYERLTRMADGRMLVEHYDPKASVFNCDTSWIGIGHRGKETGSP